MVPEPPNFHDASSHHVARQPKVIDLRIHGFREIPATAMATDVKSGDLSVRTLPRFAEPRGSPLKDN
ncbi:hypothetical protein PIB30_115598, partial [Stylosanthes scabra]|nr:hypothetical protein [Stylosanthes scabra]